MKILLLGCQGQVGWELQRSLAPLGDLRALGRDVADLEDLDGLRRLATTELADVIVNAAAYTAVDKAESEPERARRINAEAPAVLAAVAADQCSLLVHYSTDYVFDGSKDGAYGEDDAPNPLSVYGRSKLEGEQAIRASGCRHLIFRTSWVFGSHGANFARTMLRLAAERDALRVIADQVGAPTGAALIADVTALCVHRLAVAPGADAASGGTYNLASAGTASWHAYACFVIAEARRLGFPLRVAESAIAAIGTEDYPLPAPRPKNSRLNTSRLCRDFGLQMPDWSVQVRRLLEELAGREIR